MGIFGDLDVQAAADDPFSVDDGTYTATITKAEVKKSKDESKTGLMLTYQIVDEGSMNGRTVSEWKTIPKPGDADADRSASWLKQRLLSIGIPADRINSFEPEDALGIDVVITVKNTESNGQTYANVNKVVLASEGAASSSGGNSFAGL